VKRARVGLVAGVLVLLFLAVRFLPVARWASHLAYTFKAAGLRGVAVFFVVHAITATAGLPASMMALVAGFAYGPFWGLLVAWPGSFLSALWPFLLGRTVFRDRVQRMMKRSPRMRTLDRAMDREGFKLVLLLRLSPVVPYGPVNYAFGVTRISVARFLGASVFGELPGAWLYSYVGSAVATAAELSSAAGRPVPGPGRLALYVAGFVATALVAILITRIARQALDASSAAADADEGGRPRRSE
jgi:uncharacterized membrane protein YdjX (TVP38/TMEM64 family)